ncbi:integration host factor subunit alpha [Geotalea sp. SG265]|uniref:integration host factor subunit alpha n=1 Tax=Geotalea sp. SG265 TaxID=2922867 RepID=UPI001FAFD32B|nr:integration host factor subunit alpha [Geotalea sp. SG265]
MTKADIAEIIASKTGATLRDSMDAFQSVLEILKTTIATGEPVKITGFGSFNVKQKKERVGRNPQTGKQMAITARKVLSFKASPVLKAQIK